MERIEIKLHSREPHISQILTGFCMLESADRNHYNVQISTDAAGIKGAFVEVIYMGKKIIYDVMDGYQDADAISELLSQCDFYFKRSYSDEKNKELGLGDTYKMRPLGFNYHVSCHGHPLDQPYWKEMIKRMLHMENNMYSNTSFTFKKFEEIPRYKDGGFKVLFATRLWGPDALLPDKLNRERQYINEMRIHIIRSLREMDGIEFIGGISDNSYSRVIAPELVMPGEMTNRYNYIKLLHTADICIGTMGLHESIGWKTGEYVAAGKAIVNEKLHYTVPGEFYAGKNYLEFANEEECVAAVKSLAADPDKVFKMKQANREYYCNYLRPDQLIRNTLKIVDTSLGKR